MSQALSQALGLVAEPGPSDAALYKGKAGSEMAASTVSRQCNFRRQRLPRSISALPALASAKAAPLVSGFAAIRRVAAPSTNPGLRSPLAMKSSAARPLEPSADRSCEVCATVFHQERPLRQRLPAARRCRATKIARRKRASISASWHGPANTCPPTQRNAAPHRFRAARHRRHDSAVWRW